MSSSPLCPSFRGHHRLIPRQIGTNAIFKHATSPSLEIASGAPQLMESSLELEPSNVAQSCPFSSLTLRPQNDGKVIHASDDDLPPPPPGPPAFSVESAVDVLKILTDGIHGAMLQFEAKYGDICR